MTYGVDEHKNLVDSVSDEQFNLGTSNGTSYRLPTIPIGTAIFSNIINVTASDNHSWYIKGEDSDENPAYLMILLPMGNTVQGNNDMPTVNIDLTRVFYIMSEPTQLYGGWSPCYRTNSGGYMFWSMYRALLIRLG